MFVIPISLATAFHFWLACAAIGGVLLLLLCAVNGMSRVKAKPLPPKVPVPSYVQATDMTEGQVAILILLGVAVLVGLFVWLHFVGH